VGYVILPASHWLFQVASTLLLLSYATSSFLQLRILLAVASLLFIIWSIVVLKVALDSALWNLVFFVINFVRILEMLYNRRSVTFSHELELIFESLFSVGSPSTLERLEFKQLADISYIISLDVDDVYADAGDFCDRVGIIVEGAVSVSIDDAVEVMRELRKLEFLDSQEFVFQHHKYMVTMKARKKTVIVAWDKAKLGTLHVECPNIKSSFFSALAHDMSRNFSEVQKLYIRRSHKTTKYIRKLHKLLEEHKIKTNVELDIKKYSLSPLLSARYVHSPGLQRAETTKLKPVVKHKDIDPIISVSETSDDPFLSKIQSDRSTGQSLPTLSITGGL